MSADFVPHQAADVLPSRRLYVIGLTTIAVTLAGIAAAWLLLEAYQRGGAPVFPARAPAEIARVEQSLIESTRRGLDLRDAQRDALGHYQWIDRDAGTLRIPIDRAIELTVERSR
jgi:hypothetical protein